jgi:EAL domain-containing protein (putative c-di-GMP-specific phosphodiesterase class I)
LAAEIERSAAGEGVALHAQPEVALASNRITGFELVPHWKTSHGLLTAARVCEAVPNGPLRRRLARWMVAQGCFWARSWRASFGAPITVSVPLAGECLDDRDTVEAIAACVRAEGLPRGTLDLLVGETCWFAPRPDRQGAVDTLRSVGVTLTLVDFGAQTISLQRLNRMVPDRLKIHRLFVRGVAGDVERTAMARSLIALAQTLKIVAIADGITADADAQFFKWEGCDLGQGDALAPACAPADAAALLQPGAPTAH